ncbi:MAG: HDOD domain-containing protein [Telluria sp.]
MNMVELAQVIKATRDLPSLPSVVLELISTLERSDVDIATLANKISRDQALTAKTLRLANSSFYGMASKVKTVNQAITVLGFDSTRTLVTAGGIIDCFSAGQGDHIDVAGFWRHSIAVALCAKSLARHCGANQDYAFIAGLLHDIGRLVLATRFPEQYAQAAAYSRAHDTSIREAELHVLGIDHQRAGLLLADLWRFPPLIQRAIGQHHAPSPGDQGDLPGVIHVADAMVHALDLGGGEETAVAGLIDPVWERLGLNPALLQAVFAETENQFEEACNVLTREIGHA